MEIEIVLFADRFEVKSSYNNDIVKFFQTIDGRFWNKETKTWTFSTKHLGKVRDFLLNFPCSINYVDKSALALLLLTPDKLFVNYVFHPSEEKALQETIPEAVYDKVFDDWSMNLTL